MQSISCNAKFDLGSLGFLYNAPLSIFVLAIPVSGAVWKLKTNKKANLNSG